MKIRIALMLFTAVLISIATVQAQASNDAASTLDDLRTQLSELDYKEADFRIRLHQLEADLKPENIERHFNGYGSTRPEELREARRRQLQIEKDYVVSRLEQLGSQRIRLTADISNAQARVYQESAQQTVMQRDQNRRGQFLSAARVMIAVSGLILVLGSLALGAAIRRRVRLGV